MSEWKEYRLGDISDITKLSGFEFTEHFNYSEDGEIIALRALNVREGILDLDNVKRIKLEVSNKLVRSKLFAGDILFTYVGANIGQFALINENNKFHLAPNICRIRVNQLCDPYFLYTYFRSKDFQYVLKNFAVGSSQPTLPMGNLRKVPIKIPPIGIQLNVSSLFSSLDDKIELNNKINQELETLAQTLFKQWFIDFEFPNESGEPYKSSCGEMVDSELGEIPLGWEVDSLDNVAEFLNGLALQKFPAESDYEFLPVIKIRELRQKNTSNSDKASVNIPEKYIIEDGDVLFSWSGSLMIDFWTNGKGALNQHLFKVTSKKYPKWYYYLWTKHHLTEFIAIAESKATTMGHIQRQHLTNAKVLVPTEYIINNFSLVFEPIISKIIDNRIECVELIKLRDTLLPKLISGELEINENNN